MSEDNALRINRGKETELEFQVKIDGAEDLKSETSVRLVVSVANKYELSFKANHLSDDTWKAVVPALPAEVLENGSHDMRVEVIIDNYYFAPAKGQVTVLSEPTVSFDAPKKEEKKEEKAEKVEERAATAAGDITGQSDPTNALLKPEYKPKDVHKEKKKKTPEEQADAVKKIAREVIPGEGQDYAQESFNAQKVAEQIVIDALGLKPEAKARIAKQGAGFLFKKDANGRHVVDGLEDPDFKKKLREVAAQQREEKVKAILRELAD